MASDSPRYSDGEWLKEGVPLDQATYEEWLKLPGNLPIEDPFTPVSPFLDWKTILNDITEQTWLIEPIIPEGRAVAIYAKGGAGKSLLALDIALAVATGQPWAGAAVKKRNVLYLDYEMTEDDVRDRVLEFGYTRWQDLDGLKYWLHPDLKGLDTPEGAQELAEWCAREQIEFVVVDTVARAVEGPENDNDTFRGVGRYAGQALKRQGISYLRLDHAGKSRDKGQRGASAKNDDVDLVWRMDIKEDGKVVRLTREKTRLGVIPAYVNIDRYEANGLMIHSLPMEQISKDALTVLKELERIGVSEDATVRESAELFRAAGNSVRNHYLREAVKWRKKKQ